MRSNLVLIVTPKHARGLDVALARHHADAPVLQLVLGSQDRQLSEGVWEVDAWDAEALARRVTPLDGVGLIYFLGGLQFEDVDLEDDRAVQETQERGVLSLFRLTRALRKHLGKDGPELRVATNDTQRILPDDEPRPFGASLHGYLKVMTQEYRRLRIRCVELSLRTLPERPSDAQLNAAIGPLLAPAAGPGLTEVAIRNGAPFTRALERVQLPPAPAAPFRKHGVYLVLGGAGGIGTVFSQWLAKHYQARLVWVGRRPLGEDRAQDVAAIEKLGGKVLYLQADATDARQLREGLKRVHAEFGPVNGAVHSAIVLRDKLIDSMDEESFRVALAPKVQGSVALYRALRDEPLDFLMFFSSAQSFAANAGQSNYAAGCAFKDAFATWLSGRCAFPVKTVNWGYWGSVGIVASDQYREKLASRGVFSIEPDEGMEAVSRLLGHGVSQVMAFKGSEQLFMELGVRREYERRVFAVGQRSVMEELSAPVPALTENARAWAAVTAFGRDLLRTSLQRMGVLRAVGERYTRDSLRDRLRLVPAYERLHDALLAILVDAGLLLVDADGFVTGEAVLVRTEDGAAQLEALCQAFPEMEALARLIHTCVVKYPEVLTGALPATEVIFPGSSMHLLENIYKNNATADYFNDIVTLVARRYVEARLAELPAGVPVRILEVGSGTGGTSARVLEGLRPLGDRVRYVYTDISKAFLTFGRKTYGTRYPFVEFSLLDIEKDPLAQGYEGGSFDLVLATNVLHATARMRDTMGNLKVLLKANGCVAINEATSVQDFTTLIFGMLSGWWAFADANQRLPGSPLLGIPQWTDVLRAEGFRRITPMGRSGIESQALNQHVIVAESDGVVRVPWASLDAPAVASVKPEPVTPKAPPPPAPVEAPRAAPAAKPAYAPALPAPAARPAPGPSVDVPAAVAASVAQVLELAQTQVDRNERFLDMGVDSVLAVEIARVIGERLSIELRSTELFNYSSVAELARYIGDTFSHELGGTQAPAPLATSASESDLFAPAAAVAKPAAPAVTVAEVQAPRAPVAPRASTGDRLRKAEDAIVQGVAEVLDIPPDTLGRDDAFTEFGVDSVLAVEIINRINTSQGLDLRSTDLFNFSSVRALAKHVVEDLGAGGEEVAAEPAPARASAAPVDDVADLFGPAPGAAARPAVEAPRPAAPARKVDASFTSDFPNMDDDEPVRAAMPVAPRAAQPASYTAPTQAAPPASFSAQAPVAPRASTSASFSAQAPASGPLTVAIIGMSGRFPGARNLDEFWDNLREGRNAIGEPPTGRWDVERFYGGAERRSQKPFSPRAGFLDDVESFDPIFFGISPKEAEMMDPQQRLFLQEAWRALEDAGYPSRVLSEKRCGVYAGCNAGDYTLTLRQNGVMDEPYSLMGNSGSILPARISYLLNLKGPSIALDTACSSSLVALHLACEAIRNGSLEMALAGGVTVMTTPEFALLAHEAGMLSSTRQCRTFDNSADGFVPAEGVGVVVLKELNAALRDGDVIHGVIRGTGINQDGKTNGITAPSAPSQTALELSVWSQAGITAESLDYVEAHGTGTRLGDPIEVQALTDAFRRSTDGRQICAIGSVKSNIGHTIMAAGVAGILKVLLSLRNEALPPSLHFEQPNEHIRFEQSPFFVNARLRDWRRGTSRPRRAAVSSFGFSGTNAHVILEEAPIVNSGASPERAAWLFTLSAKSAPALERRLADLGRWLDRDAGRTSLEDVAYTLLCRRSQYPVRVALVAANVRELRAQVAALVSGATAEGTRRHDLKASPVPVEALHEELGRRLMDELVASGIRTADAPRKLTVLAELFVKGYELPWEQLFSSARTVPLPTYPFDATRYWVAEGSAPVARMPSAPQAPVAAEPADPGPTGMLLMERTWTPSTWGQERISTGTLVVVTSRDSEALARRWDLAPELRDYRFIFVQHDEGAPRDARTLVVPPGDIARGREVAAEIARRVEDVCGFVDLSDVLASPRSDVVDALGKTALLQELLRARLEGRREGSFAVLHFTRGAQGFQTARPTLAGASFAGLMRVIGAEYQGVTARTVDLDDSPDTEQSLPSLLLREMATRDDAVEVCIRRGTRYGYTLTVRERRELADFDARSPHFAPADDVVVITGGTGGIGRAMAREWMRRGARKLVLMGHNDLPDRREWDRLLADPSTSQGVRVRIQDLRAMEDAGARVELYFGPLTDEPALRRFFDRVRRELGPIRGVFHCAGAFVNGHHPFIYRETEDMRRVLEPKIEGLITLDRVLAQDDLLFFNLCSSISATFPMLAVGIVDYSLGNAFLASFADYQFQRGRRCFQSIAWTNWRDVGIGEVDSANYRQLGLKAHSTGQGIFMTDRAMALLGQAPVVVAGVFDLERATPERLIALRQDADERRQFLRVDETTRSQVQASSDVDETTRQWLRSVFSTELKLPAGVLEDSTRFEDLGVDSILMVDLLRKVEKELGSKVDPTAFLEYPTILELTRYFFVKHGEAVHRASGTLSAPPKAQQAPAARVPAQVSAQVSAPGPVTGQPVAPAGTSSLTGAPFPVAVIGIGCHFPRSKDTQAFWENLKAGFNGIGDVPGSRWNVSEYFNPVHTPGRTMSRWGGFIDGIEDFDAAYFGLRAEVAPHVDPLMRQMLEASVQCMRDSGYENAQLSNARMGVFVGSRAGTYARRIETMLPDSIVGVGQNFIAAHVSHLLNLRGPAMVVDTACSSSLTALHLACQSLMTGDSDMALVGGADLLLDEEPFLTLSEARALSPDGRCFTFDQRANGFVPGEGCGAMIIKPLARAIADGDRIYGVVEATALNNDGRTMGITTPNPEAQYEVIKDALRRANASPASVSYVEAHGTGTMIGDPIELRGLSRVFREATDERAFCAVGSVKSNIGHLFSAAGMASLIKVLLCLHHRQLVPTLNCETPNPRFAFAESPFVPNTVLKPWEPRHGARRAGISAFGFGGTNAHVVLRDFEPSQVQGYRQVRSALPPVQFARKRYWLEPRHRQAPAPVATPASPARAPETLPPMLELTWNDAPAASPGVSTSAA
ncbi:SDR family NAD(P)-dependent oxidoreductase [Corallococcus sp. ZKHCc1 1396]|uniref:SDR family NAD(P)-dependent oxidoreductase n=1 Tax=Corallococcus soli TaxID=2710757 RepID=A0ABR9PVA2_9BACT|nr:SDR family NAD(P)-dependent oxidoreductase [Corallococcus soli]MBE4751860.1 SDR family NAD(P)-dependent oxidoreductase [Corallococcus soli]